MTDLLKPEDVKRELADAEAAIRLDLPIGPDLKRAIKQVAQLCRDYLTLWDRNKELEKTIEDMVAMAKRAEIIARELLSHD